MNAAPVVTTLTWFVKEAGNVYAARTTVTAPDRYSAAVLVARQLGGDRHPPVHLGKGIYQFPYSMKYPGMAPLEFDGPSIHIYQPVDQAWRGVNDGAAAQALIQRHPGPGWAVQEFGLYGPVAARYAPGNPKGRSDVLVVSPDGQHTAYEIKTQGDSLGRLPVQVPLYTHTFARCVLAITPRHLTSATAALPESWGIMLLDPDTHAFGEVVREAQAGGGIMGAELALLELWGHEIRALAKPLGVKGLVKLSIRDVARRILQHRNEADALALALDALSRRVSDRGTAVRVRCTVLDAVRVD